MTLYELKLKAKEDAEAAEQLAAIEADTQKAKGGLAGTVLVSDGFFPFRDGVDVCIAQGVTAIAQPGGSLRDYEVIGAVNEASPQVASAQPTTKSPASVRSSINEDWKGEGTPFG